MKGVNLGLKVMKRLFAVFLMLGALMSVEAWEADTPILDNLTFVKDAYNAIMSVTQTIMKELTNNAYKSMSLIFNNVISILLGLIAFFWLFSHLKNGTISREEVFKALVWVITFVIVYVLMNSEKAFHEFHKMLLIPQHLVSALVGVGIMRQINSTKPLLCPIRLFLIQ